MFKIIDEKPSLCTYHNRSEDAVISNSISLHFSDVYITYYPRLIRFAKEYVGVNEDAENIVQDIFMRIWERRNTIYMIENINAYLFKLVRNKCIDHLKHRLLCEKHNRKVQEVFEMEMNLKIQSLDKFGDSFTSQKDMEETVKEAINSLPQRCREIFLLSRMEGLKYREISEKFNISISTVENQMGIALKKLKIKLKDCLSL